MIDLMYPLIVLLSFGISISAYQMHYFPARDLMQRRLYAESKKSSNNQITSSNTIPVTVDDYNKQLKGYKLECSIDGFKMEDEEDDEQPLSTLQALITLTEQKQTTFSYGFSTPYPGVWRILENKENPNNGVILEFTHPTPLIYSFALNLAERELLWRCQLSWQKKQIINEVIGSFNATLLSPNEQTTLEKPPKISDYNFEELSEEEFNSPSDMLKYPDRFDPEFAKWIIACDEAAEKGEPLPKRPKRFFRPLKPKNSTSIEESNNEGFKRDRKGFSS
eukprot:gene2531-2691_t